jgi:serine/threonine-protein kinase
MTAGDYVIEQAIAAGGCGTVYRARHKVLGRRAAIKVLSRDLASSREMLQRFEREARAVNQIQHPNIVDVYDFSKLEDGRPYYVMELLEGVSLAEMMRRQTRLTPPEVLEILEPVCAALDAAHRAGIVHRDLKGGNIMVTTRGDQKVVKLLDFGIAELIHPEPGEIGLATAGRQLGTPSGMAPEQFRGDPVDARTDIYAAGVLLHRLLTGQLPFPGASAEEVERSHLTTPAPPPSRLAPVSPAIDAVVLRCLEKQPDRRFPSVPALLAALREAIAGQNSKKANQKLLSVDALGIYLEARITPESGDESLMDDTVSVLDTGEQLVRTAGFLVPIQTGNALLAVLLLPDDLEQNRAERGCALGNVLSIQAQLSKRPNAHPGVQVSLCAHADRALMRTSASGPEVIGGPILSIAAWAPQENLQGLFATARTCEGLEQFAECPVVGKYLKLS